MFAGTNELGIISKFRLELSESSCFYFPGQHQKVSGLAIILSFSDALL